MKYLQTIQHYPGCHRLRLGAYFAQVSRNESNRRWTGEIRRNNDAAVVACLGNDFRTMTAALDDAVLYAESRMYITKEPEYRNGFCTRCGGLVADVFPLHECLTADDHTISMPRHREGRSANRNSFLDTDKATGVDHSGNAGSNPARSRVSSHTKEEK